MKNVIRWLTAAAAMTAIFGLGAPAYAQATDDDGYGDGYQSGAYGRVRSADAGGTIVRADTERAESDNASVNAPLFPGDTLRTDGNQRVEVQLAGGSIVRIDHDGELVFQSLPNASAKFQDNTVLALNGGVVRITSRLGDKEDFRIDTRDASVYLLGEGEFRITTDDRGGTRVASLRGVAEVVANETSVLVRGGMVTSVVAGSTPDQPRAYSGMASDGFDRWCASRDDADRVHDRYVDLGDEPTDVPDEVRPYYGELSTHGRFENDPEYGTVWYPTGVAAGWRPYYDGYWSYGPGGYFWVSNEPWGWAPYHYGNWQWTVNHRWCWVPGPVFAGAWVSWSWGSLSVGWAPLDFWGRPSWIGGPLYYGYYDPGCWTFVNYSHLHDRNIGRVAVPIDRIHDDLRHATVVARAPRVDPKRIAMTRDGRDRALRQVVGDRAAHMRPVQTDRHPDRRLADVQNHLTRRPVQQASPSDRVRKGASGALTIEPRPRRILEDPRGGARTSVRPETRDDVRGLYQRMSRPRETRGQDAMTPRVDTPSARTPQRREAPSVSRQDAPRVQPRREAPSVSRQDAPRVQPRREAPSVSRQDAPRVQPRREAPSVSRQDAPRVQPRREAPSVSRQDAPRAQAPRAQAPRAQAPRAEAPRAQAPRAQAPRAQAPRAQAPRAQAPRAQAAPRAKEKHGDKH